MSSADADRLLADLVSETLITPQMFENLDVDGYLDARDEPAFAESWMEAYRDIVQDPAIMEEDTLRACREQAFKLTFRITGEHELAAYISDDFGLIGASMVQSWERSPFAAQLLESYRQGRLPGLVNGL